MTSSASHCVPTATTTPRTSRSTGTPPELWCRFTIAVRRALARHAGHTVAEGARRCHVCFVKVAECQRRGDVERYGLGDGGPWCAARAVDRCRRASIAGCGLTPGGL